MSQTNGNSLAATRSRSWERGLQGSSRRSPAPRAERSVRLLEAHERAGRAGAQHRRPLQSQPRAACALPDGPFWQWMRERELLPAHVQPAADRRTAAWRGSSRRTPPLGALPAVLRLRGREAPVDLDFRTWARSHTDERTAEMLSAAAGVYTFHHDPGELSAAFVWPRTVRLLLTPPPTVVRYPVGGWSTLVAALERRVRERWAWRCRPALACESLPGAARDRRDRARAGARAARR